MNRVDRLMGYLLLFQSRGLMRAQDFAAQFEISERTVEIHRANLMRKLDAISLSDLLRIAFAAGVGE